jgi:hypothetical protein
VAIHFEREIDLVTRQVHAADEIRETADRELAYRLLGNAHEDVLTAFETYQKTVFRYLARARNVETRKYRRNWFQNVDRSRKAFSDPAGDPFDCLGEQELEFLRVNIEKRHVIGHNLSVADDRYVEATQDEQPERTVQLLGEEILRFAAVCRQVIARLDQELRPDRAPDEG